MFVYLVILYFRKNVRTRSLLNAPFYQAGGVLSSAGRLGAIAAQFVNGELLSKYWW